jgi:hypothetical protein
MDIKMKTGELIEYIVIARFREGFVSIPGHVIVTSQRLLFLAHDTLYSNLMLEIGYSFINEVRVENTNADEGLVVTSDKRISFFVMNGAAAIVKYINDNKSRMNKLNTIALSSGTNLSVRKKNIKPEPLEKTGE